MSSGWTSPPIPPSYNNNPPPDDNNRTAQNAVQWNVSILGKVGNPLKDWIDSILAQLTTSFANTDASLNALQPIGSIIGYGGSLAPSQWLLCDGSAVSRTTYSALFAALGTAFGVGDGSTTFNVPDLRGRTTIGAGTGSGLTARTIGQEVGSETHLLTGAESGTSAHTHPFSGHTSTTVKPDSGAAQNVLADVGTINTDASTEANASQAHNNMQPSLAVNYIIYAGV